MLYFSKRHFSPSRLLDRFSLLLVSLAARSRVCENKTNCLGSIAIARAKGSLPVKVGSVGKRGEGGLATPFLIVLDIAARLAEA